MTTVGDSQMAAQMPPELHKNVMHSTLEMDGFMLMASDMMEPGDSVQGILRRCASLQEQRGNSNALFKTCGWRYRRTSIERGIFRDVWRPER